MLINDQPVFIGGLSYSGKTELRLMLCAHPNLIITRRTYMWTRFYGRYGHLRHATNFEHCLTALLAQPGVRALNPDVARIRREFWQGPPTYGRLFALFQRHFAEQAGKARWGEQLKGLEEYADPLFNAYPQAQMIHLLRDPRDRLQAARARSGLSGWETARWRHSARLALRNRQRYAGRYLVVQYEALLVRPEETVRQVCSFLGEPFWPAMLAAGEQGDEKTEPGRTPPRPLSRHERAFIQAYARPEMTHFNYRPEAISLLPQEWLARLAAWPANLAGSALYGLARLTGRRADLPAR